MLIDYVLFTSFEPWIMDNNGSLARQVRVLFQVLFESCIKMGKRKCEPEIRVCKLKEDRIWESSEAWCVSRLRG